MPDPLKPWQTMYKGWLIQPTYSMKAWQATKSNLKMLALTKRSIKKMIDHKTSTTTPHTVEATQ